MIRTQISLEKREYQLAKKEARAMGISLAELVRRSLRQVTPVSDTRGGVPRWMRYAGLVESGNPRSCETIDEIVYGSKD